jgi:hypothetical protein
MRVLVSSPYPVWPPLHGGRVRVAGLARGLAAAGADVTVLSPWHPRQRRGDLGSAVEHHTHVLPTNALPALGERIAPSQAMLSLEPRLLPERLLRRLGRFDVYQFEFCAQARWMSLVPGDAKVVYSAHNVERDYFEWSAQHHLLRTAPARRLAALEQAAVRQADLVLTCTESDAGRLEDLYGPHRGVVVPNGFSPAPPPSGVVRARARAQLGLADGETAALFIGGPAAHNRDAVSFLARDVAPHLRRTRLVLAGVSSEKAPRDHTGRVLRLGYVPDLQPLLAAADVGLNPVACGSGSSLKVATYLGSGLSVLATPVGARGFDSVAVVPREGFAAALERGAEGRGPRPPTWEELGRRLLAELRAL